MKKTILFSLMLVCFVGYSQVPNIEDLEDGDVVIDPYIPHEQRDEKPNDPNYIYTAVEVMPKYPGGMEEFFKYVQKNYKNPKVDRDLKWRIIVQFVVEKNGSLSDIKVLRDLGYGTGTEAIRVLKKSKKWKAGLLNGEKVRVRYLVPITIDVKANQE